MAMAVITLSAGTAFIMWLGEQMTNKGIGNGMSLLITVGILATFPAAIVETLQVTDFTSIPDVGRLLSIVAICLVVVASIVYIQDGVRKFQFSMLVVMLVEITGRPKVFYSTTGKHGWCDSYNIRFFHYDVSSHYISVFSGVSFLKKNG